MITGTEAHIYQGWCGWIREAMIESNWWCQVASFSAFITTHRISCIYWCVGWVRLHCSNVFSFLTSLDMDLSTLQAHRHTYKHAKTPSVHAFNSPVHTATFHCSLSFSFYNILVIAATEGSVSFIIIILLLVMCRSFQQWHIAARWSWIWSWHVFHLFKDIQVRGIGNLKLWMCLFFFVLAVE